jgi:hypothetical protein
MSGMRWHLSDTFLLRRAGFSFDLLDEFAAPELARIAMRWAALTDEAERGRSVMLGELFPAAVERARARGDRAALRRLSALRRQVGARRAGNVAGEATTELGEEDLGKAHRTWLDQMALAAGLAAEVERAVEPARRQGARRLRSLAARPDVADALLQLSPDFYAATARYQQALERHEGAAARAHDRRLYSYLQRLAAKNETTSAFGPVTFGQFGAVDEPVFGPEQPDGVQARVAFVSFWAASAIGRAATRSVTTRNLVPARRLPVVRVVGDHAILPGRAPIPLSAEQLKVLRACDGTRDAAALAELTGLEVSAVASALLALERAAVIQRRCEPCSTTFDPLGDVLGQLPHTPALTELTAAARRFGRLVAEFAESPPAGRAAALTRAERAFSALTGIPARRKAGDTYADRLVLFEDCPGDGQPLTLPQSWRQRIQRALAPVLDFGLAIGQGVRRAHRELALDVLTGCGELPFLDFTDRLATAVAAGHLTQKLATVHQIRSSYQDLVAAASDGRLATLDPGQLADLARPAGGPAFASPDLLLTATGEGQLVLGEIHPYVFGWGLQGGFAPDPTALERELDGLLLVWGGPDKLATVLHRRRHKGLVSNQFPGMFLEVTGSAHSAPRRAEIAELRVTLRDAEPTLLGPDGPLELYVGEQDHAHLRVFAPAQVEVPRVTLGERTPRIVVNDVVVQRAQWTLTAEERAGLASARPQRLPLVVAALRCHREWPRHVFAASPAETKPLYLDLDAVFSQHSLRRLAELGPVTLVEMLPTPQQLWLRRSAGSFTSELRLSMARLPETDR